MVSFGSDASQSFIFFNGDSWKNIGMNINDAAVQYRNLLGKAIGEGRIFQSCGGDVPGPDTITSYVVDADNRILTWTIRTGSFTPTTWSYLDDKQFLGCSVDVK